MPCLSRAIATRTLVLSTAPYRCGAIGPSAAQRVGLPQSVHAHALSSQQQHTVVGVAQTPCRLRRVVTPLVLLTVSCLHGAIGRLVLPRASQVSNAASAPWCTMQAPVVLRAALSLAQNCVSAVLAQCTVLCQSGGAGVTAPRRAKVAHTGAHAQLWHMLPTGAMCAPACKRRFRATSNLAPRTATWVGGELGLGATKRVEVARTGVAGMLSVQHNRVARALGAMTCCRARSSLALSTASSVCGQAGASVPRSAVVAPSSVRAP